TPLYGLLILHHFAVVSCISAATRIVYIMCCRHFHQRFVPMAASIGGEDASMNVISMLIYFICYT
ncbi:hypothetical protein PMAYCL1PPCAC_00443, partial [Pristionchus mayeri]